MFDALMRVNALLTPAPKLVPADQTSWRPPRPWEAHEAVPWSQIRCVSRRAKVAADVRVGVPLSSRTLNQAPVVSS